MVDGDGVGDGHVNADGHVVGDEMVMQVPS